MLQRTNSVLLSKLACGVRLVSSSTLPLRTGTQMGFTGGRSFEKISRYGCACGFEPCQNTSPLCTPGITHRQPFSSLASTSGSQTVSTMALSQYGSMYPESWCHGTG